MKFIKSKNLKYIDEGKGKVILFLHGLSAGPASYKNTIKTLSKDFRVIAPILTSFKGYKIVNKKIKDLLEELKVEKAITIGHSAGGIHAVNFAKDYLKKTLALILVDSSGVYSSRSLSDYQYRWVKFVSSMLIRHPRVFFRGTKDFLRTMFSTKKIIDEVNFARKYSLRKYVPRVPTLILWAKRDNIMPVEDAYKLNELISGSKLEFVDGDHGWPAIVPSLLVKKMKEFLNDER